MDLQNAAVLCFFFENVARDSEIYSSIGNDLFSYGVNRRVGDLRKLLLEEIEERRIHLGKRRNRDVDTHRSSGLDAV